MWTKKAIPQKPSTQQGHHRLTDLRLDHPVSCEVWRQNVWDSLLIFTASTKTTTSWRMCWRMSAELFLFWELFHKVGGEQLTAVEQKKPKPRAELVCIRDFFFFFCNFCPNWFTKIFRIIFGHHQIIAKFINSTRSTAVIGQLLFYLNRIFFTERNYVKQTVKFEFLIDSKRKWTENVSTQIVTREEQSRTSSQSLSSLVGFVI